MKVILTVFLGVLISQSKAYGPEETCAIVQTKTFIANPVDCTGYYYCVNGKVFSQGNCRTGQSYDSYSGTCQYSDKVICHVGTSLCATVASPTYKDDPASCQSYIWCDGKGNTLTNSCPNGQHFNLATTSCVWAGQGTCAGNPCELVPNNKFVAAGTQPAPGNKIQYGSLTCFNGIGSGPNWCPIDYVYNSIEGECQYAPEVAGVVTCTTADIGKFIASPVNCNQYYYCPEQPAGAAPDADPPAGIKMNCPIRFHFNAVTSTCVYSWMYKPQGANINCDRCGGYTKGYFVDADSTCTSYKFCMPGDDNDGATNKNEPATKCSNSNYPYFNEDKQACVATKPTTGLCGTA